MPKKKALSEKQKAKQRRREDKARLPFIPDADLQVLILYWLVERQAHTHTHQPDGTPPIEPVFSIYVLVNIGC